MGSQRVRHDSVTEQQQLFINEELVSKQPKPMTSLEGGWGPAVWPVLTDVPSPRLRSQIQVQGGETGKATLLAVTKRLLLSRGKFQQVLHTVTWDQAAPDPHLRGDLLPRESAG